MREDKLSRLEVASNAVIGARLRFLKEIFPNSVDLAFKTMRGGAADCKWHKR